MRIQYIIFLIFIFICGLSPMNFSCAQSLKEKLSGKILLQVESNGEAWYVDPSTYKRHYMADGNAAYDIMRNLGVGITDKNLAKIKSNKKFAKQNSGKIFLQIEAHGEAYYIDFDGNARYLKNGSVAYAIMRDLGLGITNSDLEKIFVYQKSNDQIKKILGNAKHVENTSLSGNYHENQIWNGKILITGDTHIDGDLTILPGTVVKFVVGDNIGWGIENPPDGYNDLDPTRLKNYDTTHSQLVVNGKLTAKGAPDKKIIFTSASSKPNYADWVGIHVGSDRSIVEYCLVEWSRNGIALESNTPHTIIRNNTIKHTLWGSICTGHSSAQIYNNEIWESGHEGVDVQGGNPIIENNKIYNSHTGIVILSGSATVKNNTMINVGYGVYIASGATPIQENNHLELAPSDSKLEWGYKNFYYVMFGDPVMKPL
jgi:parallel beta-helix repeat protein